MASGNKKMPDKRIENVFKKTFLISNMGHLCYEPEEGRIISARFSGTGYPLMIYLSYVGNKRFIRISQTFSTDKYYRALKKRIERVIDK